MNKPGHDLESFARLEAMASDTAPGLRKGSMFGSPSLFVGRRMLGCVLCDVIGLRVPEGLADAARLAGRARHFTPYGKRPMREWIAIDGSAAALESATDLVRAAVVFAGENDARLP